MKPGDKVILLGFIDGCSYETTGQTNLIIALENCERVEVPIECVIKKEQVVKKDEIKLKDVIRRINRLDEDSKTYWLDTILNWFSLDFGLTKYRQGYEQGKFEGKYIPEKIVVPQFVANYIEYAKNTDWDLQDLFKLIDEEDSNELQRWFYHECNQETLAKAWIYGYEVEKEKRYLVKLKNIDINSAYLKHQLQNNHWYWGSLTECGAFSPYHTKKELEEANFGWVFNCEGIEIEEVTE